MSRAFAAVCAALVRGAPEFEAHARRLNGADWEQFVAIANEHLVSPTIHASLERSSLLASVPDDVRQFLAGVHELNLERNCAILAQLSEIESKFAVAGISAVVLKGGAVLVTAAPEARGERIMSDVDLLIRPEAQDEASKILAALGYEHHNETDSRIVGNFVRMQGGAPVDLHRTVFTNHRLLPVDDLWRASEPVRMGQGALRHLGAEHRLLHIVLHDALHHHGYFGLSLRLRSLHDLARLIRGEGRAIDWEGLWDHMGSFRLTPMLEFHLLAAGRLLGVDPPFAWEPRWRARAMLAAAQFAVEHPRLGAVLGQCAPLWGLFAYHRMRYRYGEQGTVTRQRFRYVLDGVIKRAKRQGAN